MGVDLVTYRGRIGSFNGNGPTWRQAGPGKKGVVGRNVA